MSEEYMAKERRKTPRLGLHQCVQITFFGRETFVDAEALNISESGMLCSSPTLVDNLDKIFVMVDLPIGGEVEKIQCTGVVMYTQTRENKHFFGVQFIDLAPHTRDIIGRYIKSTR
jgi:hypothetical protein